MSNVTLQEIAKIIATEFGVTLPEMRKPGVGGLHTTKARSSAMYLAEKHNGAGARELALFFCIFGEQARNRVNKEITWVKDVLRNGTDRRLEELIAEVEEQIDELHETRVAVAAANQQRFPLRRESV